MIIRETAIPLAWHPFSSTSRVVHWMTRHHGRVSTLLKGAVRPKSPFLGEYQLFGTSELLYYRKRGGTLHVGKECALLEPRNIFRSDWRSMQAASYISSLFLRATPEEAPQPGLYELYEELLELAESFGGRLPFLIWAELRFCDTFGHRPNLDRCTLCSAPSVSRFSASSGGVVCTACARRHELPVVDCPPDALSILRSWQKAEHPATADKTRLNAKQRNAVNDILSAFLMRQFGLSPEPRNALLPGLTG